MQLNENYLTQELTKSDVIEILGAPLVTENSENLWIFRIEKEQGNATFKKVILNKTLKLYFENNILKSVEEIYLN
ncbi:outer membrane protein assembly factor BamE, partial [Alphaproteobacteria bacterium]|nr:outer membrane protein assembly factor BamE [Alphaproteobacteria bacterium]